jgi:hypothetical protein
VRYRRDLSRCRTAASPAAQNHHECSTRLIQARIREIVRFPFVISSAIERSFALPAQRDRGDQSSESQSFSPFRFHVRTRVGPPIKAIYFLATLANTTGVSIPLDMTGSQALRLVVYPLERFTTRVNQRM